MTFIWILTLCCITLLSTTIVLFSKWKNVENLWTNEENRSTQLSKELKETQAKILPLEKEITKFETEKIQLLKENQSKTEEIKSIQIQLTNQFEVIAQKILKVQSQELSSKNKEELNLLLMPFTTRLTDFKTQVEQAFDKETREKIALKEEIKLLTQLNSQMSTETSNLTKALKGNVKQQGNWGEIILERILETSGLTQGMQYRKQATTKAEDGRNYQPDIVIDLPDQKHIIVDSKVSLVAYERALEANDEENYNKALKQHIASIKKHVDELSAKNYQNLLGLNSPDFVLMFMPIEASFALAVQSQDDLFNYAWSKQIVIVSPTTLLATLRTIASIWKQENQTKNALEIARLSGNLYDKLVGISEDFDKVEDYLNKATRSYNQAMARMHTGTGCVKNTAEKIKELGAKTSKQIPEKY